MKLPAVLLPTLLAAALAPAAQAQQGISLASGLTDLTSWTVDGSATALNATLGNGFTFTATWCSRRWAGATNSAAALRPPRW